MSFVCSTIFPFVGRTLFVVETDSVSSPKLVPESAIHLKLNELIAALKGASNRLINAEGLTEKEIETLQTHYFMLLELAKSDPKLTQPHSVEEAAERLRNEGQQD